MKLESLKTKSLILGLVIITAIFSYLTVQKMKSNAARAYKVLKWQKYDICFLVAPNYEVTVTKDGFSYTAGKNSGEFTTHYRGVDPGIKQSQFGELKGGYSKEVDFRTFEYEVQDGVIIRDRFDFVKKNFANLLPVRANCSKYLKRFPVLMEI